MAEGRRREERAAPDERRPREDRAAREQRGVRAERPRREGRGLREDRPPREDRGPREERGMREERFEREGRGPREERFEREDSGREPPAREPSYAAPQGDVEERGRRRRRGRRGGRGRGEGREAMPAERVEREPVMARDEGEEAPMEVGPRDDSPRDHGARERSERSTAVMEGPMIPPEELAAQGKKLTEQTLVTMGFEATVTATADADRVDVNASVASDDELLTGRKGEVRQALQHLLNRMLNRGEGSRYHLQLEINEFWKHREDELRDLARALAEEALESQSEMVTEYLNAQERRIVHMTLKDDGRVKTYALGNGLIKRVAVAPADYPEGPREE
jgi:predicted RNA-binding protein Jag